jgi:D-alanyl-D-alanine carboxypeptidase
MISRSCLARAGWLILVAAGIAGATQVTGPAALAVSGSSGSPAAAHGDASAGPATREPAASPAVQEWAATQKVAELAGASTGGGADLSGVAPVTNFAPLPPCRMADDPSPRASLDDWRLTLLDTTLAVPQDYVPPDLTSMYSLGFSSFYQVRRLMGPDLLAMTEAAGRAGVALGAVSGYRSYGVQEVLLEEWKEILGEQEALRTSARPGHSEHQLGLAVDFSDVGGADPWSYLDWAQTATGQWLARHAWRFGFVMSYPQGKESVTCYGYEPWHYRYVGRTEAAAVHDSGLTLREWLWRRQPEAASTGTPVRGIDRPQ